MPRNGDNGPACGVNFVGDDLNFDDSSSSEDEVPLRNSRVSSRANDSSDEETQYQRKASSSARSVQGHSAGRASGSVRVHSLSGPSVMSAQAATAAAAATPLDSEWKEVRVSYRLCASLRELADGEVEPELKLSNNAMQIFDNSDKKRSENHICGGVSIVEYDSSFPASLHIDVDGIKSGASKSFTQSGTRGALTIRPRGSFSDARGIEIAAGNMVKAQKSAFLREYKGWTLNNVDDGITFCKDGVNAMVESNHPIVAYYNAVLADGGDDPIGEGDIIGGTSMFMAKVVDVDECLASLKRTMQESLQIQNLYDVAFKLSRAYGDAGDDGEIAWDDAVEVLDGVQGAKTGDAIMDQKRTLYMTAAFKVRTLDE